MKNVFKYFILVSSIALSLQAIKTTDQSYESDEQTIASQQSEDIDQTDQEYDYTISQAGQEIDKYLDKQINKANLPINDNDKKAIVTEMQKQLIVKANPTTLTVDELTLRKAKKGLKKQLKKIFAQNYADYAKRKENYFSKLSYLQAFKQIRDSIRSQLQIFIVKSLGITNKAQAQMLLDAAMKKVATRLYKAIHEIDAIKAVTIDKKEVDKLTQESKEYIVQKTKELKKPELKKAASVKYLKKFKKIKPVEQPKKIAPKTPVKKGKSQKHYGNGAGPSVRRTHGYYQEEKAHTPAPEYKKRPLKKLKPVKSIAIGNGQGFGVIEVEEPSRSDYINGLSD